MGRISLPGAVVCAIHLRVNERGILGPQGDLVMVFVERVRVGRILKISERTEVGVLAIGHLFQRLFVCIFLVRGSFGAISEIQRNLSAGFGVDMNRRGANDGICGVSERLGQVVELRNDNFQSSDVLLHVVKLANETVDIALHSALAAQLGVRFVQLEDELGFFGLHPATAHATRTVDSLVEMRHVHNDGRK